MLIRHLAPKSGEQWLFPGDIHFDKHDPGALSVMLHVAADVGISGAVLIGDTFESAGLSRHPSLRRKLRFGRGTIRAEREAARPYIETLRALVGATNERGGNLHVLTGNHEHWWSLVQDEYPGLIDTPWNELYGDLFDGWHVHREYTALKMGPLLVCHGHRLRGSLSKFSAAAVLGNYPGQNTLYGHTHRMDSCTLPTFKYGQPVRHGAWTIGHLKDPREEQMDPFSGPHAERHTQGFGLVTFFKVGGDLRFNVEMVAIDRDGDKPYALVRGKVYY